MIILGLRTDKPEAELYLYDGQKKLAGKKWQAHRELAETIHKQVDKILNKLSILLISLWIVSASSRWACHFLPANFFCPSYK